MKHFILPFILLNFLIACESPKRAGSFYNPEFYKKMSDDQKNSVPINKQGDVVEKYHSALGNLCSRYHSEQGDSLVCSDGEKEQNVRVLR
jgi:hypothetical protein